MWKLTCEGCGFCIKYILHVSLSLKKESTVQISTVRSVTGITVNEIKCPVRLMTHLWDKRFKMNECVAASLCSKINSYAIFSKIIPASYSCVQLYSRNGK